MKVYGFQAPTPQGPAARDQQAFLIGLDFHEAALRAGQQAHEPDGAPIAALCPMVVCYAFAAELYLKSLLQTGIRNHRLNVLYAKVSQNLRNSIGDFYFPRTGRNSSELEGDLRSFANAFSDWRYIFEGEGQQIHLNLLIAFTKAVYETIRTHRREWHVSTYRDERFRAVEIEHIALKNLGGGTFVHLVDPIGTLNRPSD